MFLMLCYMQITTLITTQAFSFTVGVFELSLSQWTWIISTFHSIKRWWCFGVRALCQRGFHLQCWMVVQLHSMAQLKTLLHTANSAQHIPFIMLRCPKCVFWSMIYHRTDHIGLCVYIQARNGENNSIFSLQRKPYR